MIERLRFRNFQCWKKYDLELDPHVTIIVGPSDKGKSALLRGLRWLATNRPAGDTFIAHGREAVGVTLSVDGRAVKRSKSRDGKRNLFQLDDSEYVAFGQDVPRPIAELLNLDSALNFQRQRGKDPDFWFALTPGEVAKEMNRVVNLELIDRTLANAAAEARRVKATIGVSEERLSKAKAEAERLAWVTEADAALRAAEDTYTKIQEIDAKSSRITALIKGITDASGKLDRAAQAKIAGVAAVKAGEAALAAQTKAESLREAIQDYRKTDGKLTETARQLATAKAELARVDVCPACGRKT